MLRTTINILAIVLCTISMLYFVCWAFSFRIFPVTYGISFNQKHATDLSLDWKEVYQRMLDDLAPQYVRIAAMWSEVEATKGEYSFTDVDFMMDAAAASGAKVQLVVGQKAPRWPECHVPNWAYDVSRDAYETALFEYVEAVVQRYKGHPALELWQVENEAFINFTFGECEGFRKDIVKKEVALVRELDPTHEIVMTDSGELSTWYTPSRLGDKFGTTLYRVVRTPSGKIFTYDFLPPGFYRIKAILLGVSHDNFYVSELQAEPWFDGAGPTSTPINIQEQTMNSDRLKEHILYAQRVGASRVHFWGVEWWYYMKEVKNHPEYWEIIKSVIASSKPLDE